MHAVIAGMPDHQTRQLLEQAGEERFDAKVSRFQRWIECKGTDQAFYEAWMEALGYKSNKGSFRLLAQQLPLATLAAAPRDITPLLFGVANLLPVTATQDGYTQQLWKRWWKLRPHYLDRVMPTKSWQRSGIRPANHPHRRLGIAAALIRKQPDLFEQVQEAVKQHGDPLILFTSLEDAYWNHHFTLGGKPSVKQVKLIGSSRAQEILGNVILPFCAASFRLANKVSLAKTCLERFRGLRRTTPNATLRLAAQQLFDSQTTARRVIHTACQQQGLLQVFQDFCLQDKTACEQCPFPELVEQWTQKDNQPRQQPPD